MIFKGGAKHQQKRGLRRIKHLKKTAAKQAMIYQRPSQAHAKLRRGVNAAAPDAAAEKAEVFRVLANQQRFRFAIAGLLLQVSANRRTPIVPHKAGWTESEFETAFLKAPAHIDIVARLAKEGVEAADFLQRPFVECHVASRAVLGLAVGQPDVRPAAG